MGNYHFFIPTAVFMSTHCHRWEGTDAGNVRFCTSVGKSLPSLSSHALGFYRPEYCLCTVCALRVNLSSDFCFSLNIDTHIIFLNGTRQISFICNVWYVHNILEFDAFQFKIKKIMLKQATHKKNLQTVWLGLISRNQGLT